jgi:general secretion pathway protein I
MKRRCYQTGFSLLEIVVAFSIAAGSLALLYRIQGKSAALLSLAEDYAYATDLAESLVAEFGYADGGGKSRQDGIAVDKFRWEASSQPFEPDHALSPDASGGGEPTLPLHRIVVSISWKNRDRDYSLSLETLRPSLVAHLEDAD